MNNIVIINGMNLSPYVFEVIKDNKNSLELVIGYAAALPDVKKIVILSNCKIPESPGHEVIHIESNELPVIELFNYMTNLSEDYSSIFYIFGDCPLLDADLGRKMYNNHKKYFSEYTFADGYPYGISPEIIQPEVLPALRTLAIDNTSPVTRETVFDVIRKDINAFDIETEISPEDLRLLRVSLSSDTKRNFHQMRAIINAGGINEESLLSVINLNQDLLRSYPAYYQIQITDAFSQKCSYLPTFSSSADSSKHSQLLSIEDFSLIVEKIESFSDDAVISLSFRGEPALHPDILLFIKEIYKYKNLSCLIETSGVGWKPGILESIRSETGNKPEWIVMLDSSDAALYKELRGDGMDEAVATAKQMLEIFPGKVHIQAVRMKINEDNLEGFFRLWKKETENVIIQKYDCFCGSLPESKVTDLSPLIRDACWHLKRDVSILTDGTVLQCPEVLNREYISGNIFTDDIETIWNNGTAVYLKHLGKEYPDICRKCDEYYTYNF